MVYWIIQAKNIFSDEVIYIFHQNYDLLMITIALYTYVNSLKIRCTLFLDFETFTHIKTISLQDFFSNLILFCENEFKIFVILSYDRF